MTAKPDLIVRSHPCHGTLYCLWKTRDTGAAPFGTEPSRTPAVRTPSSAPESWGNEPFPTPADIPRALLEDVASDYGVDVGDLIAELWGHPDNPARKKSQRAAIAARDRYRQQEGEV